MSSRLVAGTIILVVAAGAASASEKRQLDAHEHGHGTLNIAVEGSSLHMELNVPGADIVGFEHAATSSGDKAKIKVAKKMLSGATSLFSFSTAAGCKLSEAKVELEGDEDDKHEAHGHKEHGHKDHGTPEKAGDSHSEFHVHYAFKCTSIGSLGSIGFPYFKAFPNAEELDVTLITDKGQKSFDVSREKDRIDLQGMM